MASLKLTFNTNTVILNRFIDGGCKLTHEVTGDVAYSINGASIDSGIQYERHRIYTIEAVVDSMQNFQLECLFKAAEKARKLWNPAVNYVVTLEDTIHHYSEEGNVQTRALATGGAIVSTGFGLVYPAKFKVRMMDYDSEFLRQNRSVYKTRLTLKEIDRVLP